MSNSPIVFSATHARVEIELRNDDDQGALYFLTLKFDKPHEANPGFLLNREQIATLVRIMKAAMMADGGTSIALLNAI